MNRSDRASWLLLASCFSILLGGLAGAIAGAVTSRVVLARAADPDLVADGATLHTHPELARRMDTLQLDCDGLLLDVERLKLIPAAIDARSAEILSRAAAMHDSSIVRIGALGSFDVELNRRFKKHTDALVKKHLTPDKP